MIQQCKFMNSIQDCYRQTAFYLIDWLMMQIILRLKNSHDNISFEMHSWIPRTIYKKHGCMYSSYIICSHADSSCGGIQVIWQAAEVGQMLVRNKYSISILVHVGKSRALLLGYPCYFELSTQNHIIAQKWPHIYVFFFFFVLEHSC